MANEIMYARLGEIAFKAESTKGTKQTLTLDGTDSPALVYDIQWNPDISKQERVPAAKDLSAYQHTIGTTYASLTFKMDLRKTAITATEDAWGPLMAACGCKFTSGTGTYQPTTDQSAHKTLTMYAWLGSNGATSSNSKRVGIRGAMGNARLIGNVGERGVWEFEFKGVHDPADSTLKPQADDLNAVTQENAVPAAFQGTSITYGGTAIVAPSFTLDFGNTVVPRETVGIAGGAKHFVIANRTPTVEFEPESDLVSVIDWLGNQNTGATVALAWTYTQPATTSPSVNARTFTFGAPVAQLTDCTPGNRNGIETMAAKMRLCRSSGDDEWTLAITGS